MPSKFWKQSKHTTYPDIPSRSTSRLDQFPAPESFYSEEYRSEHDQDSYPASDHSGQPPGHPHINLTVPADLPEVPSYESSPTSQTAPHREPKKSLKQRLGLSSSRENVSSETHEEHGLRLGFKRKNSVRRKEAPPLRQQEPDSPPVPQPPGSRGRYYASNGPGSDREQEDRYHQASYASWQGRPSRDQLEDEYIPPPPRSPLHQGHYHPYRGHPDEPAPSQQLQYTPSWPSQRGPSEETDGQAYRPASQPPYPTTTPEPQHFPDPRPFITERTLTLREHFLAEQEKQEKPQVRSQDQVPALQQESQPPRNKSPANPHPRETNKMQPGPRRGSVQQSNSTISNDPNLLSVNQTSGGQQIDSGRRSPPGLMRQPSEMSEQDVNKLQIEYRELREKYSKVKRYYFEKEEQVKNLQNTLAHQRLAQSRTSLDDGEYVQRLTRLDGLISQLAFSFRKDWKIIPSWLQSVVNKDATAIGKQEMIAVGRAYVSKWLLDEVFDFYFHPSLHPILSLSLKDIQKNIKRSAPPFQPGSEEEDLLISKIVGWRLATNDGLQSAFSSTDAANHRQALISSLNAKLVHSLQEHMADPSPAGLEGAVGMIIELAVSILSNLPFESREVQIDYYMPGHALLGEYMKLESGLPALTSSVAADKGRDVVQGDGKEPLQDQQHGDDSESAKDLDHGKKGFFGGLIGGRKGSLASASGTGRNGNGSASASTSSLAQQQQQQQQQGGAGLKEDGATKVRMCLSLSLQVRGKNILTKALVFGM